MILSSAAIYRAIKAKELEIVPEPLPPDDPNSLFQTSAIDLRLSGKIAELKENHSIHIDLSHGAGIAALYADMAIEKNLAPNESYSLEPKTLVLGQTLERIHLPLQQAPDRSLAARIEGRSSYARAGLAVHCTAPTIHAGFRGPITLELINFGRYPIVLHAGDAICQLILERVEGAPTSRLSQFHDQRTPGGSA